VRIGRLPSGLSASTGTALIAVITGLGLILRLRLLGNSLFGDELSTYSIVTGHSPGQILHLLDGHSVDLTPPLSFLLSWLATRVHRSPETLRLFSLLAGTAAVPMTYRLGRRCLNASAGLAGALVMALCPFLIFYSTEARAYALVMALALASTLALLVALETRRPGWWAVYAVASCAAMYTHYTAVFVLAVQAAWALSTHRGQAREILTANLGAALGFAPWLPALIDNTRSVGTQVFALLEPFGAHAVTHDGALWAIGHPYLPLGSVPGPLGIGLIAAGLLGGAVLGLWSRRGSGGPGPDWQARGGPELDLAALPVLLALATPVGLVLYSALGTDTWDVRNLISSSPGLALVLGGIATAPTGRWRLVTGCALVAGFALGGAELLRREDQRPDYAAAARIVLAQGRRDSVAIISSPSPGPDAAMDAAFAFAGDPGRRLLRVGSPTLSEVLRARPYAALAPSPARALAAQTAGDELFVVAPGRASLGRLLAGGPVNIGRALGPVFGSGRTGALLGTVYPPLEAYLRAVAGRYQPVGTRVLPGFLPLSVYVLRRRG
jgi:hypothetical protein